MSELSLPPVPKVGSLVKFPFPDSPVLVVMVAGLDFSGDGSVPLELGYFDKSGVFQGIRIPTHLAVVPA